MINVADIVADADLVAPKPFTILRSVGRWINGGFESTVTPIEASGPVQRDTGKELDVTQQADIVGGVMAFWWTQPLYVTRGAIPSPANSQGVTPQGVIPGGTVFTLDPAPPPGLGGKLFKNGLFQIPGIAYQLSSDGTTITLGAPAAPGDDLYFTWPSENSGTGASDILVYANEQYRVLSVKHYPGSGYWKALGTRMSGV